MFAAWDSINQVTFKLDNAQSPLEIWKFVIQIQVLMKQSKKTHGSDIL